MVISNKTKSLKHSNKALQQQAIELHQAVEQHKQQVTATREMNDQNRIQYEQTKKTDEFAARPIFKSGGGGTPGDDDKLIRTGITNIGMTGYEVKAKTHNTDVQFVSPLIVPKIEGSENIFFDLRCESGGIIGEFPFEFTIEYTDILGNRHNQEFNYIGLHQFVELE